MCKNNSNVQAFQDLLDKMNASITNVNNMNNAFSKNEIQLTMDISQNNPVSFEPVTPVPDYNSLIKEIQNIINLSFGLKADNQIKEKLNFIFKNSPLQSIIDFYRKISTNHDIHPELEALIEDLVVNETYFYRDIPQMELLRFDYIPKMIERKIKNKDFCIKIWSSACSTGEEAYTMAMLIFENLIKIGEAKKTGGNSIIFNNNWHISILGTDLSKQVVSIANSATYNTLGLGSFRDFPEDLYCFLDLYNIKEAGSKKVKIYKIKEFVKKHVKFKVFNLKSSLPPIHNNDIVLCRNVLIYMDEDAKHQIYNLLYTSLGNNSALVMGPADTVKINKDLESYWSNKAVIYLKK